MSGQKHIVIIGGNACGAKAAARARRCDPSARITIIEEKANLSTATCGLPYYIGNVITNESALVARQLAYFRDVLNIDVIAETRAIAIHPRTHTVEAVNLKDGRHTRLEYDRLVLATGSSPVLPPLEGSDLKGVFTLSSIADANAIRNHLAGMTGREVVIIGAGLIGLEMAEAFTTRGFRVTIVEAMGRVLPALLDDEIAIHVEKHLRGRGVTVYLREQLKGLLGDRQREVGRAVLGSGEIPAGLVLLAMGVRPNSALAKEAGLSIGNSGGISVDEHLRTSNHDIYAGGDCVEVVNRITGRLMLAPLGSTANRHGRIIGTNVTGGSETFPGVLGTTICKVFDLTIGRVGLSESQAKELGLATVCSIVPSFDHATYYPGARDILVKLVAETPSGRLLGGQVIGSGEVAKRIDVLAGVLSFGGSVSDLAELDLSYAPPYN
ncbi:MAG: FAD-dependent oxidoreductase, partial [Dehalococcoidales bacterium]|nr:FAD-dependent oxidoreductase [Dehalococcoidales bacterium]